MEKGNLMGKEETSEEVRCNLENTGQFGQPTRFWGLNTSICLKGRINFCTLMVSLGSRRNVEEQSRYS